MLLFVGKLLDVSDNNGYKSLVFETTRFDNRLSREVPISDVVGISKEDESHIASFKEFLGQKVFLPVVCLKTKNGNIFYLTRGGIMTTEK